MRLPTITGTIKRRLLVNFRVAPAVIQRLLPAPFQPKLHKGHAIAGICLIRLEGIRPAGLGLPAWLGISSENAAHRIAVEWTDEEGMAREGVFIPRRDTGALLNHLAGGRIFPGEHHHAKFTVTDDGVSFDLAMESRDRMVSVHVKGRAAKELPASSCFGSLKVASAFFEGGSLGYSVTRDKRRLDGLSLETNSWQVTPLAIEAAESSYFTDQSLFPAGSVVFDHALVMRDIAHEWHTAADMHPLALGACGPACA
ncbi:MAG: hypothetical protein JWO94_3390 [Verrucomicrobiaceae bacterium]|nr:hypothetical protein [Verrucomicrobiaceae bacterium]